MKRKTSFTLLILIIMVVAVGCQQTIPTDNNQPKEITIGDCADFTGGFNIISGDDNSSLFHYTANIYETLVIYDKDGVKPWLAESWQVNENKITFKLRENVKFSDGCDFNATAVKTHFEVMKKTIGEQMSWFAGVSKLQKINVISEYEVEFVYDSPYIVALQDFTVSCPMAIMSPSCFKNNQVLEIVNTQTMGTGPYLIESFEQGKYYTFIKNENYWGDCPHVDKFTVKILPDLESRMLALQLGEIDIIYGQKNLSQDSFVDFKNKQGFNTKVSNAVFCTRNILFNSTKEPFNDLNVRLAVQHAINKEIICSNLLYGLEDKADYILNKDLPYCNVSTIPYDYNEKKALQLLTEAGYTKDSKDNFFKKNGEKLSFEILFRTGWGAEEDICQAVANQLRKIGFEVKVTGLEVMAWYGKALEGQFQATVNDTYGIPYDPHTFLSPMLNYSADNPAQQGLKEKPELDKSITKIFNTINKTEIQECYSFILKTLHKSAINLPISYTKDSIVFNSNKISDYIFEDQTRELYLRNIVLK
ncbi:nickel ABC transporter, nickel/metallophore periplasmic binding protein [Clostridium sp. 'deep sea']|uniref:nickel ABC transporter substrate-binding protein n=1 Tax=Clostridium sp. 'deep sea' TaxID=2779445 RepID=UPI00189690EE|nr:nickel ABC transporter substrate-binding protein [Clostridium sp. 'deep sea']QOR34988.1 nickel ABC transporter, nickel/metallophore periplasmic binding protein [Clostridium sp. 'deep sea']